MCTHHDVKIPACSRSSLQWCQIITTLTLHTHFPELPTSKIAHLLYGPPMEVAKQPSLILWPRAVSNSPSNCTLAGAASTRGQACRYSAQL